MPEANVPQYIPKDGNILVSCPRCSHSHDAPILDIEEQMFYCTRCIVTPLKFSTCNTRFKIKFENDTNIMTVECDADGNEVRNGRYTRISNPGKIAIIREYNKTHKELIEEEFRKANAN